MTFKRWMLMTVSHNVLWRLMPPMTPHEVGNSMYGSARHLFAKAWQ